MSNNSFNPDDPNQSRQEPPHQGQQGKLVLGNFQDQQKRAQRRPYQYPSQQGPQQPSPGQPPIHPQPSDQRPEKQIPPLPQRHDEPRASSTSSPSSTPEIPRYPYPPQGQTRSGTQTRLRRRPRRSGCLIGCLVLLLLACILGGFTFSVAQRVLAFGSAISTQAPLSTETGYMSTSERTNLLIMGYGGGNHDGAYLTDSILVVSLLPQSHHTSLVSVPRDLYVQYPPNSGQYTKFNSIYEFASNNDRTPNAGGTAVIQKVSLVTGMNVKYWLTIDFTGFKKVIDAIGGVDVAVPDSFNACYPKNDDANVDASWIKIQFNKGMQHMDGTIAIQYARAREPLEVCGKGTSENLAELSDFGRSARQQIIIKAVLSKVKQVSTWPHLYDALDALQKTIHTNMSLADLSEFALKMDLNDPKAARIGLSNQNVLEDGQSDDGQYILRPANGDWSAIPTYIKQKLYN